MANVIQIKKNAWGSTDPPADSDVIYGELAWENDSKRLYIGRQSTSGGAVVATHIGGKAGIASNNTVTVDDADAADNDYAKFTANGVEGRSYAEVKTDLSLNNVDNTALSTWAGTSNITTLGTIGTGTWNGAAIPVANGGTGSTSASDARTALGVGTSDNVQFANATVTNLTVNGTTTTVNSTVVTVDDPIFTLGGDGVGVDDDKDRGIEFKWHTGSAAKVGFFGRNDNTGRFAYIADATNSSEVFSGTLGDAEFTTVYANVTGNVTGNTSGSSGSCTGLAATATALATARTIGGVSFDGTANISLPGVNASGTQDTSGNAATVTTNANLTGDITSVGNATAIASGVIVDADVKSDAAIAYSKLGTIPTWNQNTTGSSASCTGNAATVTNGVYTNSTIDGGTF